MDSDGVGKKNKASDKQNDTDGVGKKTRVINFSMNIYLKCII